MQLQEFKLRYSNQFIGLIVTMVGVCCLSLSLCHLPISLKILNILISLAYGVYLIYYHCYMKGKYAIQRIKIINRQRNEWLLFNSRGCQRGHLRGDSTLTAWVSILRFQAEGAKKVYSCVIFPDTLAQNHYRQLIAMINILDINKQNISI